MEAVLIDTSIIIGLTRNEKAADEALARIAGAQQLICDVVLSEVLDGARNEAEHDRMFAYFTRTFQILPFTMEVSLKFRSIVEASGKDRGAHLGDHLIAAIALAHAVPLLTLNKKHFTPIKGLKLA